MAGAVVIPADREVVERMIREGLYATQIERLAGWSRHDVAAYARALRLPLASGADVWGKARDRRACVEEVQAMSAEAARDYLLELLLRCGDEPCEEAALRLAAARLPRGPSRVVRALWRDRPRVLTHERLLEEVVRARPVDEWPGVDIVKVYVSQARRFFREAEAPVRIRSEFGVGYSLHAPPDFNLEEHHA